MAAEKILVAFDGSAGSKNALKWALNLASKLQSQTLLVAVANESWGWSSDADPNILAQAAHLQRQQLRQSLEAAEVQFAQLGLAVSTQIRIGSPGDELIECAQEEQADMIVTGTRGFGTSPNLMLGSVAHKLVTYSPVPVVVVK